LADSRRINVNTTSPPQTRQAGNVSSAQSTAQCSDRCPAWVDSVDAALFNRLTGPENPRHTALTCRPKFARSSASLAGFALFIDACSAAEGTGSGSRLRRLFRHGHGLERRVAVCRENARRNFARGYPWNIHIGLKCFTRLNAKSGRACSQTLPPRRLLSALSSDSRRRSMLKL
jgi:hypothetical protein